MRNTNKILYILLINYFVSMFVEIKTAFFSITIANEL